MAAFCFARQKMGVRKLRLTGGEPLMCTNLSDPTGNLTTTPAVEDLAVTTNGVSPGEAEDCPGDRLATLEQV